MNQQYQVLSLLLQYPDEELIGGLRELEAVLEERPAWRERLQPLLAYLGTTPLIDLQQEYVATFDRNPSHSLHLFEHVHGDSRDRGPAMIDLIQHYEKAGLFLGEKELPDHLCVILEFASTQPAPSAREFIGEMAHILQAIFSALRKRDSAYASLVAAVLELAGHRVEAVPVTPDEALDESWAEPEAFGGCSTQGQAAPGQPQPIQIVRRPAASPGAHP